MKKRSFRSTFVSVILVITVAISIVNLAVYGINIKKIRQVEVLKMKTAGERIDDMITISLNNIKGLKQICCTDNYARNILLKNNEKNDIGTKFENQNYMDNALKHIASMDTLILRATIVNKYGNIYCTDTSIPEEYVKTIRNMTKEWMLFEGKEDEYYYGGLQGDNANILTFLYPLHTYGNTPIALLAVDINYKTFQSILENAFYEDSGECFILTGEQELFHIGEDLYQKEEKGYIFDKSQKMMKENLIVDTFQSKGKNFYISSRQNMLSGWKIIQVIPEERLFEEVDQKIKWNSIFLLGALILVVSFSIYYTKKIIEPLEEFCKKISHTKGDQLQIINLEHMKLTREIANVIENYNEMANKMNEYLVREIIYDKNQRKIQSKMLRYGLKYSYIYNCTTKSEEFLKGYETFIRTAAVLKSLRTLRIAKIGERPVPFMSVMTNEANLIKRFGITTVPISPVEICNRARKILEEKGKEYIKYEEEFVRKFPDGENYQQICATKLAVQELMEENNCSVAAFECWSAFPTLMGLCPCVVLGEMADNGMPLSCETDINGAITLAILRACNLFEESEFLADLTIRHPQNDNAELLWHCGPFPYSLKKDGVEAKLVDGQERFELKQGDLTVCRFDDVDGEYYLFAGEAKTTTGPETNGTYVWMETDNWKRWEEKLMFGPYIHHLGCVYGHYLPVLREVSRYLGIHFDNAHEQGIYSL